MTVLVLAILIPIFALGGVFAILLAVAFKIDEFQREESNADAR